ncbi:MAG: hypothetical protein GX627_01885 [Parcubacteria group bacterium]|jgi:hypothetical protein|nr:hypothetical protein [Parcubacteria group bacterium]
MSSNFQSSFIPKEPITANQVFQKKKMGALGMLAVSLFIASIVFAVAVFVYKNMVNKSIANLQSQLAAAEEAVDKETINEMSRFSQKLEIAKSIVDRHKVISNFLAVFSSSTVSTVTFDKFDYSELSGDGLVVNLSGEATSYGGIALQEEVFYEVPYFKSIDISGLKLSNRGTVNFNMIILVDPKIAEYSIDSN